MKTGARDICHNCIKVSNINIRLWSAKCLHVPMTGDKPLDMPVGIDYWCINHVRRTTLTPVPEMETRNDAE